MPCPPHTPLPLPLPESPTAPLRVLLLPGWQDSGPGHWQSRWEALHGHERVRQHDWHWPRRGDWMARLDDVLLAQPVPAVLVAHSLGCLLVDAWAAHSRHTQRVQAALLVAPPDTSRPDTPPPLSGWSRPWLRPLPFAAQVLYSDDDPFCDAERARAMAQAWGAPAMSLGRAGHINADTGWGDWPEGLQHLHSLLGRAARTRPQAWPAAPPPPPAAA